MQDQQNLVEAAGAAPLAAALQLGDELAGMRTALIASGGNVSREQLLKVLGRKDAMTDTPHEGLERTTP